MQRPRSVKTVTTLAVVTLLATLAAAPAAAVEPVNETFFGGLAVDGYDTVAYFEEGRAVKGKKEHSHVWRDAIWRFASVEHLELFKAEPEKYAPQYGGYCALAVARGKTADADPEAWKIVDGKLYLNFNKKFRAEWEEDVEANIRSADANWPKILAED